MKGNKFYLRIGLRFGGIYLVESPEDVENFEHALKTALEEPKHERQFEFGKMKFLNSEERLVKTLQTKNKEKDYILCQELECPVCLKTCLDPPIHQV